MKSSGGSVQQANHCRALAGGVIIPSLFALRAPMGDFMPGLMPSSAPVEAPARPLTVADLAALPAELPSGPVRFELDNGRLIVMPPPGDLHGAVDAKLQAELVYQGERRGLGKARSEVGVILWRDPDRVVGPDAVFIA